jgi:Skp family chaperone for outer membrane proteins
LIYFFSANKFIFSFIFSFFFLTSNIFANNISTINIAYILEKSNSYNLFLDKLKIKENEIQKILDKRKIELDNIKKNIKDSELIINDDELDNLIQDYNSGLMNLENDVKNYNLYFEKNIEQSKEIILDYIIEVINKLSNELDFDIILSEQHYFMSTKNIDISEKIITIINKKNIELKIINE